MTWSCRADGCTSPTTRRYCTTECRERDTEDADAGEPAVATDGGLVETCDLRGVEYGETVTLVYSSARSGNEVEREVTRANLTGVGTEFEGGDGERITVTNGVVRSHTSQHTVLGEFRDIRR